MANYLLPTQAKAATPLQDCLEELGRGQMAALWQAWPKIAGAELTPHCRPLRFQGGVLWVGVEQPHWLLALRYAKHQLLGALRGSGFLVQRLEFEQRRQAPIPPLGSSDVASSWAAHPSRVDIHGSTTCPSCKMPTPAGEIERWRCCSLCLRQKTNYLN
jgi:predicted nucleic acid-binding Zn ribbon protein